MKKEFRVRKHSDFDRIIKKGLAKKSPHFAVFYERSEEPTTHIGIAVSKKNGGAVTRVKIKRQIRAMISELWKDYSLPLNLVIIVKTNYQCEDFRNSQEELKNTFEKIKENISETH